MQEREARLLTESNDVENAIIQPSADKKGWTLKLITKDGTEDMLNSKRSQDPRVFKTSDACLRCCARIGITSANVAL